jgi:hypothetical protein
MSLVLSQVNGQFQLSGITHDPNVLAPLGSHYVQIGPHWFGFDDRFVEPVIVRAYYDVSADIELSEAMEQGRYDYLGYMQFMRLSFRGMVVPPGVYQGQLASRQAYAYGFDQKFIDFMGPADARIRGLDTPAYPFNAMLLDGTLGDYHQFMAYPLVNGSLYGPDTGVLGDRQALAPSLTAEIASGLLVPADVASQLTADNLLLTIPVTNSDLAAAEPYRIALNTLENSPLPGYLPDGGPPLQGLDETGIAGQAVGDYVLLTLPDPENFGNTLVVSTAPRDGGAYILVHVLSDYDMEGLTGEAARRALWRINEYQIEEDWNIYDPQDLSPPDGRGMSGLYTPPYALAANEVALVLDYWTVLVGVRGGRTRARPGTVMLSAVNWAALFQFDEDTGQMNLSAIRVPDRTLMFDLASGLAAYEAALREQTGATIDVSNFTRAAMRRDNFAAGRTIRFVNIFGTPLT